VTALGFFFCVSLHAAPNSEGLRQRTLIDADWRFHRGEVTSSNEVIATSFEAEKSWERVQLPHDYQLDGKYEPDPQGTTKTTDSRRRGYLPVEVGWYRKHFFVPESDQGKILQLEFGGIFRDSQVWLNGQFVGNHASGYTGFFLDVTKAARCGADNVLVVRVDPRQREGWWYEGSGIYRHVFFTATAPLHVANYGTYVTSTVPNGDQGADTEAEVTVQTSVENSGTASVSCGVVSEIVGPNGTSLKTIKSDESVDAGSKRDIVQHATLKHPQLWSLEAPNLYQLRTTILQAGKPVDSATTTFGIRTIHYDADKGFFLNGKHVKIYGVANHQDLPAVGIAVPDSLQSWRVKKLKEMGCNGWRTAHNPPNEALLDACDRLGMLVMDENRHLGGALGDKTLPGSTETNLDDLAWMIQRDRNHPSIIMWSMCNEEGKMQGVPEGAKVFSAMKELVLRYDKTRPVTSAMHGGWMKDGFTTVEDLVGVNYHPTEYDEIHRANPRLPMYGSETANTKTTRGVYQNDSSKGWASAYNMLDTKVDGKFSPGICINGWPAVASRPFMLGSFTWTGFDYKGEPNPFGWPDISNNTGLMDVCGFPKDKYYYLQACWSDKPMVHLMPMTWNWEVEAIDEVMRRIREADKAARRIRDADRNTGGTTSTSSDEPAKPIRVIAFSNARQVELSLNGKSLGTQTMPQDGFLEWNVPFQPGRLMAKAYANGKTVASDQIETTDAPAKIQFSPDRTLLHADGQDALVVPVSILDGKGRVVPYADNRVSFQISGGGRILGVGNGNPSDHDPDRASERNAFHGHCIVIIQAGEKPDTLRLTATSSGITKASLSFQVK
jgi:beta-galactosidase